MDTLLPQLGNDCEAILVDDGSTDCSRELCDDYAGSNNVMVIHKQNGGLSSARNAGIDAAQGEWLLFLDSDDYLQPGSLALLKEVATTHSDADFIQYHYCETSGHTLMQPVSAIKSLAVVHDKKEMFTRKLALGGVGASACTKLIARSALKHLRFKPGIIHEDELFTMHLIDNALKAVYIDNTLYVYVQRPGSIITAPFTAQRLDLIPVLEEQIALLERNGFASLAAQVRHEMFRAMCRLYVGARQSKMSRCADVIKNRAKTLAHSYKCSGGAEAFIARGMRIHLPMLQLYYLYKSRL